MNLSFRKYLLFVLLSLYSGLNLEAQSRITGTVSDERGADLEGANIYLKGTYDGTSSGIDGSFQLLTEEKGKQILCIEFIGYEAYCSELYLRGSDIQVPPIQLREAFNELTAVSITAGTFEAGDKKKSIALSPVDMVTTAGAAGNIYAALQSLPGTSPVGESGKLFVKGGDSHESRTYIDGTLVYVPYSSTSPGHAVRGRFNPFMFSGTTFSTGGYSAEYGQALSSVLSLQTNAMPVQDQVNISLLSVGAELGGTKTWDNASVSATLEYENLGPYMKLVPQFSTWDSEPQTLSGDLSFRLNTGKKGLLKFYTNANQSRLKIVEDRLDSPGSTYTYGLVNNNLFLNGSWNGEISEGWIVTAAFSYTDNQDHIEVDSLHINEQLHGSHAKLVIKHRLNDKAKIIAGTELYTKSYQVAIENNRPQSLLNNTWAGFVEAEIYASSNFITRLGTRIEYSDYLKNFNMAPRISSAYKFDDNSQVSLSYGWFFQDPEDEFLLYRNDFAFERADHYTLNYIWNKEKRMLRSELYFKDYKQLVKYEIDDANEFSSFDNSGSGYAYGLDVFWRDRKSIKNAEYWISYSYIEAKRDYLNYPYEAVPGFTSRHNLNLVYKHWIARLKSQVGGTYRYSSPRYFNNPNLEEFNSERTIPYQSLDVNWSYLPRQNVIFYFSISNLLGMKQEFGQRFALRPNEDGVYLSEPKLPAAKRFFVLACFITLSKGGDLNQLDKIN